MFQISSDISISSLHADFRTVLRFCVRLLVVNYNDKVCWQYFHFPIRSGNFLACFYAHARRVMTQSEEP